jgi:hypothetical protein
MVLTADQQAQVDIQMALENARHQQAVQLEAKRAKLEAIRLAKETLLENARSKPVDGRDVTATDITSFAQTLVSYIDS